jgi:hypothetical protein
MIFVPVLCKRAQACKFGSKQHKLQLLCYRSKELTPAASAQEFSTARLHPEVWRLQQVPCMLYKARVVHKQARGGEAETADCAAWSKSLKCDDNEF